MRLFRKWLKSNTSNEEAKGEHGGGSSFNWLDLDQTDSSILDTRNLKIEKSEDRNALAHNAAPDEEDDGLCSAEEDKGIDPYNTGRFDTKNK